MIIVGAGMAGLLAANMLRNHKPIVIEQAAELPNNHHSLLRFRTDAVAAATAIQFKKVSIIKHVKTSRNPIAAANSYANKVTGRISPRSIISTEPGERFIAPPDLIERLAANATVKLGRAFSDWMARNPDRQPVISTMPMPSLMGVLGWEPKPEFEWRAGWVLEAELIDTDVYQTIYYPDWDVEYYRASITGNKIMIEFAKEPDVEKAQSGEINAQREWLTPVLEDFGLRYRGLIRYPELREQHFGKIVAIDDRLRKEFMSWATHQHNIYSLGRFAVWRPGLLLDDVVKDVRQIERFIAQGEYARKLEGY